jgi:hypothetical protein
VAELLIAIGTRPAITQMIENPEIDFTADGDDGLPVVKLQLQSLLNCLAGLKRLSVKADEELQDIEFWSILSEGILGKGMPEVEWSFGDIDICIEAMTNVEPGIWLHSLTSLSMMDQRLPVGCNHPHDNPGLVPWIELLALLLSGTRELKTLKSLSLDWENSYRTPGKCIACPYLNDVIAAPENDTRCLLSLISDWNPLQLGHLESIELTMFPTLYMDPTPFAEPIHRWLCSEANLVFAILKHLPPQNSLHSVGFDLRFKYRVSSLPSLADNADGLYVEMSPISFLLQQPPLAGVRHVRIRGILENGLPSPIRPIRAAFENIMKYINMGFTGQRFDVRFELECKTKCELGGEECQKAVLIKCWKPQGIDTPQSVLPHVRP